MAYPTTPFRESTPTDIPDRVAKLEKAVSSIQSGFREGVWAGWRRLGWLASTLATIAAISFGGHFVATRTVLRGSAWGAAARRNAEREALKWGQAMWPTLTSVDLYCSLGGVEPTVAGCFITAPDRVIWRIVCDDDDPVTNDGCDPSRVQKVVVLPTRSVPAGTYIRRNF